MTTLFSRSLRSSCRSTQRAQFHSLFSQPSSAARTQWPQPIRVSLRSFTTSKPPTPPSSSPSHSQNSKAPHQKRPPAVPSTTRASAATPPSKARPATSKPPPTKSISTSNSTRSTPLPPSSKPVPQIKSHTTPKTKRSSNMPTHSPTPTPTLPARLLIYTPGRARILTLATLRLTSTIILALFTLYQAPAYYLSTSSSTPSTADYTTTSIFDSPLLIPVAIVLLGSIPLTATHFLTAPFVTYVHLILPAWARTGKERLARFAGGLPSGMEIEITTMRWVFARITRCAVRELHFGKKGLGKDEKVASLVLRRDVPQEVLDARRWYAWRPLRRFLVAPTSKGETPVPGTWESVIEAAGRGWEKRA